MSQLLLKLNWNIFNIKFLFPAKWWHSNVLQCVFHDAEDKRKIMMDQRRGIILTKFFPKELSTTTFFTVDFPIVVIDQLLNESLIFFFHLVSHVGNITQNCLIFYLKSNQIWLIPWIHYASPLFCLMKSFAEPFLLLEFPTNDFGHRVSCILKTGHFVSPLKPQVEVGVILLFWREKKSV